MLRVSVEFMKFYSSTNETRTETNSNGLSLIFKIIKFVYFVSSLALGG